MKVTIALTASLVLGLLAATPAVAGDHHDNMRGHHHHCHWVGHGHHRHRVCR